MLKWINEEEKSYQSGEGSWQFPAHFILDGHLGIVHRTKHSVPALCKILKRPPGNIDMESSSMRL